MSHCLDLPGVDGANPLGFLTVLGTLQTLTRARPERAARLAWRKGLRWVPVLHTAHPLEPDQLVEDLDEELSRTRGHAAFGESEAAPLGDDLTVSAEAYRVYAAAAAASTSAKDRRWADFAAAFACDSLRRRDRDQVQDTAFRTMSGAGHQHFLGAMRELAAVTTADDLRRALFEPWCYEDGRPSMRWDPRDDRRYALRWDEPSKVAVRTVRGANRLAIEALPLFPSLPDGGRLRTTGFRGSRRNDTFWRWPLWVSPAPLDVVRSLIALRGIQEEAVDRNMLATMGVGEVFESQRIFVDRFINFSPSRAV